MAWHVCPRCRLHYADNDETPFSEREDFNLDESRWTWTISGQQRYGFSVDVRGSYLDYVRLTLRLESGDPFTVTWQNYFFLFIGECCVGIVPRFSGAVARVVLGVGWVSTSLSEARACALLRLYDDSGHLLGEVRTPIACEPWAGGLDWQLESVTFDDGGTYVAIHGVGGVEAGCCPRLPKPACDSAIKWDDPLSRLNYLAADHFITTPTMWHVHYRQATKLGASLTSEIGFGDCCTSWRFRVSLSAAAKRVALIADCGYGGVVATLAFPSSQWMNTDDDRDYDFDVCVWQLMERDDEGNQYYRTLIGVRFNDSVGRQWTGTFSDSWGVLGNNGCCESEGVGYFVADRMVVDAFSSPGRVTQFFSGPCVCFPFGVTPQPNECLRQLCLGGYWPPEEQPNPPDYWSLRLDDLPGTWAFASGPLPEGTMIECSDVTTEYTSPYALQIDPNLHAARRVAYRYIGACCPEVPEPEDEIFCVGGRICVGLSLGLTQSVKRTVAAAICRPVIYEWAYANCGYIPVFVFVRFIRRVPALNTNCECRDVVDVVLAGRSPFPNCQHEIPLSVIYAESYLRECREAGGGALCGNCLCPEMDDFSMISGRLIPVHE